MVGSCLVSLCGFVCAGVFTGGFCSLQRVVLELRGVCSCFVGLPMCSKLPCGLSAWCTGGWMSPVCAVFASVVGFCSFIGSECVLCVVGVHCLLDSVYMVGSGECICLCGGLELLESWLSSQLGCGLRISSVRGVCIV